MRGLAAVLTRSGEPAPDSVERMLAAAPHRGERTVVKAIGACALGVSELEGRDEASLASDGSLAVAFAGALDNVGELGDRVPRRAARRAGMLVGRAGADGQPEALQTAQPGRTPFTRAAARSTSVG